MITCQKCNQSVSSDAHYCANCGTPAQHPTEPENFSNERPSWLDGPAIPPAPLVPAEPPSPWEPDSDSTVVVPRAGAGQHPGAGAGAPPQPGQQVPPQFVPGEQPPSAPPFASGGFGGPPALGGPQFVSPGPESAPRKRGAGTLLGVGLGVIGLAAVGFLGIRFVTGGSGGGGAGSPEDVATEMVAAINAQDPLALVSLLAPDELDGLDDLVESVGEYSEQLGLGDLIDSETGGDNDLGDVDIDIDIDRIDVSMEGDNAAIVAFELSGDIEFDEGTGVFADIDGDDDVRFDSRDLEGALPNGSDEVEMIVVRLDGSWYASPMLTAGHYIVQNNDLDDGDYDSVGDDSQRDEGAGTPVDAVERFAEVLSNPDADDLAAILGGGEGRAALVFRDAIDEGFSALDDSNARLDVLVDAADLGGGRVEIEQVTIEVSDDFDQAELRIEGDCARVTENGDPGEENCITDVIDLDNIGELDRRLILETVEEGGSQRVRIIPTITDVLGRFVGLVEEREVLLAGTNLAVYDDATEVDPGTDIDIDFAGQLYTVHEFEVEEGETYHVTASGDTAVDLYIDQGFGIESLLIEYGAGQSRDFRFDRIGDAADPGLENYDIVSGRFTPFSDGMVRVVTYSDIDGDFESGDCIVFECLPTGEGSTTLRIREAGRQTVAFPQRISGDLGPGDVRVFEIVVDDFQFVEIDVTGSTVGWDLSGVFRSGNEFELDRGTHELVVYNTSGDEGTSYTITPTAVR